MSDDEALEAAITENLCRVDVSPIEEAAAYKRLADTGRYSVESLAVRFGKSETYIRNRMRLNELTDKILDLVNGDGISMTVALEICKYSADVQSDVYEKHLSGKPTAYYGDWRSLTARVFVKRLENDYCTDLSRYRFDKSECAKCPFNTNCYSMFSDGEGRCSNLFCLQEKTGDIWSKPASRRLRNVPEWKSANRHTERRKTTVFLRNCRNRAMQ
jgi:ParB family chromosome partitioning protein